MPMKLPNVSLPKIGVHFCPFISVGPTCARPVRCVRICTFRIGVAIPSRSRRRLAVSSVSQGLRLRWRRWSYLTCYPAVDGDQLIFGDILNSREVHVAQM
jgi:hypothetical protein